jgi:hypothetical protein
MLERNQRHCSKNAIALGSETVKSSTNGSSPPRRNCLRNVVKSDIFRTGQKSRQVYESAALTAELRAPARKLIQHILNRVQGVGHAFEFLYRGAFRMCNANRAVLANACFGRVTFWMARYATSKSIRVSCENVAG